LVGNTLKIYRDGSALKYRHEGKTYTLGSVDIAVLGSLDHIKIVGSTEQPVELVDEARVWDDLRIVPGSFDYAGVADPSLENWQPGGSGRVFKIYKFKKNDVAYASTQMPHDYKEGTDLEFHIHWTPADRGGAEAGNIVGWKVDYSIANVGSSFPASSTADLQHTCTGTDDFHEIVASVAVNGSDLTISHIIELAIYRSDTGADDTWVGTTNAQSPGLLEFDIHYEKDGFGSREETTK